MIVVTGRVETTAEKEADLIAIGQTMCRASRDDAGCLGYRLYADTEQPHHFVFIEEWEDDDALQAHFRQPHTAEFMGEVSGLLAGQPDASFHTVASTRRLGANGVVE